MILTWDSVDAEGHTLAPQITVAGAVDGGILLAEIGNWSATQNPIAYVSSVIPGYGSSFALSSTPNVTDVAILTFRSLTAGVVTRICIPGPADLMFLPDGETVDPFAAAPLIASIIAHAVAPGGEGLTTFVGGIRQKLTPRG